MALQPYVRDYGGVVVRSNGFRDGAGRGIQWVEPVEEEGLELVRMEEDTELEEGETVEGGPHMDDLDSRTRYLDTRIEEVLGDCQKDFEGSLFADKLGSKLGCYGTFLPTHVRGASVLTGPPQAPAGVPPRSRLLEERGRRVQGNGSIAVPDRSAKASPNGTGMKSHMQNMNGVSYSGDGHAIVPVKSNKRKAGVSVDQKKGRSITVRINLNKGANKVGKQTIYNGFGLDNSSSPSTDENPDEGPLSSEESSPDRSPGSMIRIMTTYPRDGLLSPTIDFLSQPLDRKEKPLLNAKGSKKQATGSSAVKQELGPGHVATKLENDVGKDAKVVKEKTEKVKGKPVDRREAPLSLDSGKVFKKDLEIDGRAGKEGTGNGPKVFHKVAAKDGVKDLDLKEEKTERDVDVRDVIGKEVDTLKDSARSSRKEKVSAMEVPKEVLKEDGLEFPISDSKEVRKTKEEPSKGFKRSRETSVEPNLKEIVAKENFKEKRKMGGNKDTVKAKREEEAPQKDSQKQQFKKDVGKHVETVVERDLPKDGLLEVKKKSKESSKGAKMQKESKDKARDAVKDARRDSKKESSKKEMLRDVDDSGKEEPKESSKANVHDVPKESLKDLGKRDSAEQGLRDAKAGKKAGRKGGKEPKSGSKEIERDIGPPGDILGPVADATGAQAPPQPSLLPLSAVPVSDTPVAATGAILPAGQLVLDHWVQCDNCQQWRLLAPMIEPDDLPEKWLCKMMTWLPGLNNCKFTEDITTAAVYELLGLQNPQLNPGLQAQQQLLAPGVAPPPGLMPNSKMQASKPVKVNRSGSKKGMGKKAPAGTVRNSASSAVKSKSLNDVGQHPVDQVAGLETIAAEDVGYAQVAVGKVKQKEKLMRMWANEGDDLHPQNDRNRATGSWPAAQELGKTGKQPVTVEVDNGAEGNAWVDVLGVNSLGTEPKKQQKGKLLQDGSKGDSAGAKRKKKPESSEENDEPRSSKKGKVDETRNWRSFEPNARRRDLDDLDTHSLQYASDEGAGQEGESGDRGGGNNRNVARGGTSGQPLKKAKLSSSTVRDIKIGSMYDDIPDSRIDERSSKDYQKQMQYESKRDSSERLESSDTEKDEYHREEPGRRMKNKEVRGKVKPSERDGKPDTKRRTRGNGIESGHQAEKRRHVSKPESKEWVASRDEKKGQVKRVGSKSNLVEEQLQEDESPEDERVEGTRGRNAQLFDEISGIARTYAPQFFEEERADESPNGESPLPGVRTYNEQAGQQRGGSQHRSPPSSSSKVSYSAESSAFGSKGGSPIESTVSSTPVRSSKVDGVASGRGASDGLQNNHTAFHSHPSNKLNSVSPSPKRLLDQDGDTHSDREGALRQSHRNWDDGPHSSEPEREFRGPGRDPGRETASGRGRDDRYATSNSREGPDFRKYDRSRGGRDDDHYWEESRETRAGSASYFTERGYERHRDERNREREDSVDRYRDREPRYERRGSREDRFRERDRDREREQRDRSRENWAATDRSGDVREERYSREKSVRQDRGGRPSSRESRLDKQGSWHEESRLVRDVGREGRERVEDDNAEIKHDIRSNHVEGSKDDRPGEDEHEAAPDVQKDDSGHRYEKIDLGSQKDAKFSVVRAPPPGQASHGWEGDKAGAAFSGRKDSDAVAPRNGLDAPAMSTHVNSRSRVDVVQSGQGSTASRGKAGQVDGVPFDLRIVEDAKQVKEHKKVADEVTMRVGASKAPGSTALRVFDGGSSSLTKKQHSELAINLSQEGTHLKHSADRLKSVASMEVETPNLYLQASLKFLQAAHHYEMASMEGTRQGCSAKSIQLYKETASFFDFCAGTYERQRDHAAGALAHICAAVARFRAMMGKAASFNKDCMELQNAASLTSAPGSQVPGVLTPPTGLPPPPPPPPPRASEKPRSFHGLGVGSAVGESPSSSSASDVDNQALTGEKGLSATAVKGAAPSPTLGSISGSSELVPQRLQGSYLQALRNGMDFCGMMESWTKAQNATAAAEAACAGVPQQQEGMDAVRRVVEIGLLGNMDSVVRQVRIALEAIGH